MSADKYIFKKKLGSRRKSKRRLFTESSLMFMFGLFLIYIYYLLPNKYLLIQNSTISLKKLFFILNDLFTNIYEITLVLFIFLSPILIFILFAGSFNRIILITKRKKRMTKF